MRVNLEEIRAKAAAATPGPWNWEAREENGAKFQSVLAVGMDNPKRGAAIVQTYHREGEYFPPNPFAPHGHLIPPRDGTQADAAYIAALSPDVALAMCAELAERRRICEAIMKWYRREENRPCLHGIAEDIAKLDQLDALERGEG
jgi:hypothetical protein